MIIHFQLSPTDIFKILQKELTLRGLPPENMNMKISQTREETPYFEGLEFDVTLPNSTT